MRTTLIIGLTLVMAGFSAVSVADHEPNRMMKNMKYYADLSMTGMLGPFTVNFAKFGDIPSGKTTLVKNKRFDQFLSDKMNIAAIVMKNGEIIYERYNEKRKIDSNTPLHGMSMSKTATAAVIGHLLCEGKISSLNDTPSKYSKFLATTPFANIKIRNILQMNSGVSPLGRGDEKKFNRKSRGMRQFEGKASVREALAFYSKAARTQGDKMNYHSTDSLTLSVLAEDIAGTALSHVFYENIYKKFGKSGFMQWTSDKTGTTLGFADLVMTARDWANFANFLMEEKKKKSCFGNFFNEGVNAAVNTGKSNGSKYGYQSWVFNVSGRPTMTMQGHGGQFAVLDEETDTVLLLVSINEKYKSGNLFSRINRFAERLHKKTGDWN
jgi:CubicO group peptidase (beta-lactamase class C family)